MHSATRVVLAAVLLAAASWGAGAQSTATPPLAAVHVDLDGPAPQSIKAYHLFKDFAHQVPNDGVVPYDLTTPLFSNYATKHRFVWMPPGTHADYDPRTTFHFPVGAVLIKTFGYLKDIRDPSNGERLIETRLLIHTPKGWIGRPYVWNEDMTDARLAVAGAIVPVTWTHYDGKQRSYDYVVPNMNKCKQCHGIRATTRPIGPKARYLNKVYPYASGSENELVHWTKAGYLTGAPANPDEAPRAPVWNDPNTGTVEQRARAYLDINCAHCHEPGGVAYTSGLDLRFDQTSPIRYGVYKTPVAAGRGATVGHFAIDPGHPDRSILLFRMTTTDPGMRMPIAGRGVTHKEGVALIRKWIAAMKSSPAEQAYAKKEAQGSGL